MFNKNHLLNWWFCTFSAMLSSLRNWANHGIYRLWPSTPAQLCWSSSRLQPLRKYKIINSQWFCRQLQTTIEIYETVEGRPTRQPGLQVFCSVSQRLNFIFAWNCLMFAPINSLVLSGPDIRPVTSWRSWSPRKNYMCHGIICCWCTWQHQWGRPVPLQITPQHDSFKTRITPMLATAIRYQIYKRSAFFGDKVNRVLPNATVLWWL